MSFQKCKDAATVLNERIRGGAGIMRWMVQDADKSSCLVRCLNIVNGASIFRKRMSLSEALHHLTIQLPTE